MTNTTFADGKIISGTETTFDFGSSAGTAFKDIQFRLDLARGSTTTSTPDVRYVTLEYNKVIPKVWGWSMILDCTQGCNGVPPKTLLAALVTAAETETLVTFVYRSTTHYVQVMSVDSEELTGDTEKGTYRVFLREVK